MPPKAKKSTADAAAILRVYESEVDSVERDIVTTTDGQRYQLTGDEPGDYVWLKVRSGVPQILAKGDD